jgi:hypothetical protein
VKQLGEVSNKLGKRLMLANPVKAVEKGKRKQEMDSGGRVFLV